MPGDLKARAPARNRAESSRRGGGAAGLPRVARDELGAKMMDFAPADLCNPDPRLVLRKRLREEMEALRGILKKAELLAGKTVGDGRAAPRHSKDGRFLAAEARPAAMEADRPSSAKRRKTMPLAAAIKPRMSADEISNLATKRRRTMPLAAVVNVKPRMSADEISNLATRVSLLSEDMPARILEFLKKVCTGHEDGNSGEIEIDIGSMRHPALFELRKLLDEFAEEEKHRLQKEESTKASRSTSCSPLHQHEDGEIVEEDCHVAVDTCSYASPMAADKVLPSPARTLEDSEIAEEEVICGGAAPVATEKFDETGNSPSSSSSSSSSSSGSSSSSSSSSGGSSSDSSDSDSSDSDSDDESVTSSPAPAVLPKTDDLPKQPEPLAVDLCSSKSLTEQDTRSNPIGSGSNCCSLPEDGEIEEKQLISPPAQDKFAETVICPTGSSKSSGSAGDGSVCSITQQQQPAARDRKTPLSEAEYRDLIAKGRQKQRRQCDPERKRAYEELEEKERNATPISDWIHPMQLRQLGITPVEHAVTSERRVPGRRSPVQKLLGLFLKAE